MSDTGSTSTSYVFICNLSCSVYEKTAKNVILEVLIKSKVFNRLDLSDDFWEQFNVQNKDLKRQVGLYEVENIDNTNILTIAINPKEYFEKYKDYSINKRQKARKKILLEWILHYMNIALKINQKNWTKKISSSKGFNGNEIYQKKSICRFKW